MSQSADTTKDVTVGCKIEPDVKEELEEIAEERNESVSAVVRDSIRKYLIEDK